jgi:hypothetical protein
MHFHPFMAAFVIPITLVTIITLIPYLNLKETPSGFWFHSEKGKASSKFSAVAALIITTVLVLVNEYLINFETLLPSINSFISNGMLPLLLVLFIIWSYYKLMTKKLGLSVIESLQAMFVYIITSFIILTIIGIFFRGVDMQLTFPWNL